MLSSKPKEVTLITHAGFAGFRAMNLPDAFAKDEMVVESSFDNDEVNVTDMFANIAKDDDEGETGQQLHPGYRFGVATLAVQSNRDARIHGKFSPATMDVPGPLEDSEFGLTYIHVLGAWPLGTDPRLWYVHSCAIRRASPNIIRKRFMPNKISGECFVLVSHPGSTYGSPVVRPKVLLGKYIKDVCLQWGGGAELATALMQAKLFTDDLEIEVSRIVEDDEEHAVGLCVNGLWAWVGAGQGTAESGDLVETVLGFCKVHVKRESMRVTRYDKAWSRVDDRTLLRAIDPDFVEEPNQYMLKDAVGFSEGVVPPYFDFVPCFKSPTSSVHVAIRANQLRAWLLSGYIIGMQQVFSTVVACNSIRPPPEVVEGKCRVRVPSRFLMSLGLVELRFLWALLYAPKMLGKYIHMASGAKEVVAEMTGGERFGGEALQVWAKETPLDTEVALRLATGERADLPAALQVRNVLYALWKLSCGDREPDVQTEVAHMRDPRHALSVSLIGVPYQAFYVLQARTVIDRTFFRDSDLYMLSCMPPLHSLQLEMLERMHDGVRCVWTSGFEHVGIISVDNKGDALPMDDEGMLRTARSLFPPYVMEKIGDEIVNHMRKSMEMAKPIHCIPLGASALNDYIIAPNGAVKDSLANPSSLYTLHAYQNLANERTVTRLRRFSLMDEAEADDTKKVICAVPLGLDRAVPDACVEAASWLSIAPITLPPEFSMHAAPSVFGEKRPVLTQRLPPVLLEDALRMSAKLTPSVLRNRFLPSERIISSLQWVRNGSNGIYASAAVKKMGDEFFGVFDGSMTSIGDLTGGDHMFWMAFNWLVAIGAATSIEVPPEDYAEAVHDYDPPVAQYANLWQIDKDLGPKDPRAFNYRETKVTIKPMFKEPVPKEASSQEMPTPSSRAGSSTSGSKPKAKKKSLYSYGGDSDSDSDDDFDFKAMMSSIVHEDDRVGGSVEDVEPVVLLPPQAAAASVDPILAPAAVAKRCSAIAGYLDEIETRAVRLGKEMPVMAASRVRGFCRQGHFNDSVVTQRFMTKREVRKPDLIRAEVVTEEAWESFVDRPDMDLRINLSQEQKEVLHALIDPDGPAVRVFVGRAGTGKTALMSVLALAFGIEALGSCLFLANMNVNVQAWQTMLGMNGRVSTIASYLLQREKVLTSWLKKHMAYVRKHVNRGKYDEFPGGYKEFETMVTDLPLGVQDPADVKCIFVEEAGNVSDKVMRLLLAAITKDFPNVTRVVFFGDPDQLDPVEPGAAFAALVRHHERRNNLLRLTKVFHTDRPLLMHTALMVTNGKASRAYLDYIRSGCTLTGPGFTKEISANPEDYTEDAVFHFDPAHGMSLTCLEGESVYKSKEVENAFICKIFEVIKQHDSEWIHLMAHRKAERDAMNKAARMLRKGIGSAMPQGGGQPALVSGDTAVPLARVAGGRVAKNTPVIVLGFVSPQAQALAAFDWQKAGDSIMLKGDREYTGFWGQARHQLDGNFKSVVFVSRPDFFASMLALVHKCERDGVPLAQVLPRTDLSNEVKVAKGEFVPHHLDLKALLEWPRPSEPWIDLPGRKFGAKELHIVLHDPAQWALGYATTGAAAQGSRAPHVILGMLRISPYFDWPLLNVILTRAMYSVWVVCGWSGGAEYLRKIVTNRNVSRTNVLPAFLAHKVPELEPEPQPLALEAPQSSTQLIEQGASSSSTRPRSPTPDDDHESKRQKRLRDDTVESYLRRNKYETHTMDGDEMIPDYTHEYRGLQLGTEVPNGGALTVNIKIGDTWFSKYMAEDPGWSCTHVDYMRVSHKEADALLALFPDL